MKRRFAAVSPNRQRGISLPVALIFLTLLALAGTSATLSTNLQERMASNARSRNLAFEAAEAALKDAENTLATWRTAAFNGTGGLLVYNASRPNDATYWGDPAHWTSYRNPAQILSQVAEQPRYVAEKLPPVGAAEYYRVTVRGVGGDANAVVVLQALYTYTP